MIQEYLFIDNEKRSEVEEYRPEKVTAETQGIENTECWIATYFVPGENEEGANLLSKVNEYIMSNYQPTVLSNGCAAYYNKSLFPFINEFERKLRKLLYLKSALNKGDEAAANIRDLESKDLGEIFALLFADAQFVKDVKTIVNSKTWQFTRQELLSVIEGLSENTIWDKLIGEASVPALREKFVTVKDYRNDVMHAHDIDAKTFRASKKLFEKVNEQLDIEIGKIIGIAETPAEEIKNQDYNSALSSALKQYANVTAELSQVPITAKLTAVSPIPLSEMYTPYLLQSQQYLQEALAGLKTLDLDIPTLVKAQEIASKIDIPAMTEALQFQTKLDLKEIQQTAKLSAEVASEISAVQKPTGAQHDAPAKKENPSPREE